MDTLLTAQDIEFLQSCEDDRSGYYYKMAGYLEDIVAKGVVEERFTREQAQTDLQFALWYAYACNNIDDYDYYYKTVQWLPVSEPYANGCGAWYYRYSVALMYCGRLVQAQQYAEEGARQEPDYPWVWLQVAKLRSHFKDKTGALAAVEQGLALVPGDYEFNNLRQEIEQGATIEQMEYHLINPENDAQLQQGLDPNADDKMRSISCITLNEAGLHGVRLMFQIKDWLTTEPYCSFYYPVQMHPVQIVFYMNEAGLSKMRLDWLKQQKEVLTNGNWLTRTNSNGQPGKLEAVLVSLDYKVMLAYALPYSDEVFYLPLTDTTNGDNKLPCV